MQHRQAWWPDIGLLRELASIEWLFEQGGPAMHFEILCRMATVVAAIPPGEVQEQAEDRLAALIACAMLEAEELRRILALRSQGGIAGPSPASPALRRGPIA